MNKNQIKAASRKALIAANKSYYSWSAEQQEAFRANMDVTTQKKVGSVLLNSLLGIKCAPEDVSDKWSEIPVSKVNSLNWAKLLTTGIGDDFIYLNDFIAEDKSLLSFTRLYDYDYYYYLLKEQVNKEEYKNYKARDYYALQYSHWIRLLINNQFQYASLCSLAEYLIEEIHDIASDYINQLIPHSFNEGEQEKGGGHRGVQIEAAGKEKQLEELFTRWIKYTEDRWFELSKEFSDLAPAVFRMEQDHDGTPIQLFLFNHSEALKQVRWRTFIADCELLNAEHTTIAELKEREITNVCSFLKESLQDIMKNYDPKVVKLEKKMKIIVVPELLDKLTEEDSGDDSVE